jgi:hypothetical protein
MPYRYALRFDQAFTLVRFEGVVTGDDLLEAQQRIFDAGRPQGVCSIWDTRDVTEFDVAPATLPLYRKMLRAHTEQLGTRERVAVIASEEAERMLVGMFVAIARNVTGREHKIVRTMNEAAQWTGLSPQVLNLPGEALREGAAP